MAGEEESEGWSLDVRYVCGDAYADNIAAPSVSTRNTMRCTGDVQRMREVYKNKE